MRVPSTARAAALAMTFLSAFSAAPHAIAAPAEAGDRRVIVLGFDGADSHLTEQYMDEGYLPNLAKLRAEGCYAPLGTTTPPQTPVSWSSFATGKNPGKHGIFDFLRRDLATYQPDFAMYRIGSEPVLWGKNNHYLVALALLVLCVLVGALFGAIVRRPSRGLLIGGGVGLMMGVAAMFLAKDLIPYRRPTIENTRKGDTFWEIAGRNGIATEVVRVPATFPPAAFDHGHILSGLGVPDIRGTFGTFTYYTTEQLPESVDENTEMGGKIIQVSLLNGETDSFIFGPRNRLFDTPPDIEPKVHFKVDRSVDPPTVTVTTDDESKTVRLGEWSDWFTLRFTFSPLVTAAGIARFYFQSSEPFGLYMSAINLDPHRPVMSVSEPPTWSAELAEEFGSYKTLGWAMDTWALNELRIDEKTFLEDVYFTESKYAEIMRTLLDRDDWTLYVHCYELTDRVAHVFWRFLDPTHPAYDSTLAATYGNAVRDSYVFMDDVVGDTMKRMRPTDLLYVLSDHGFHTWHQSVNYNTWLVRNGYMALKNNSPDTQKKLEDLFGQGQFWPNVDWSRTKAYAMGLGDVYINLKGREAHGIVEPGEEYERIRDQLVADLTAWADTASGDHPVRRLIKREDVYNGYDPDLIPDLFAANAPKYRVSWQTSLGGIPPDLLTPNNRKWSGDHCSFDAEITKGVFFANRRLDATGATIYDLFPTILQDFGIPVPADVDGKTLAPLP
jgi:predicted AlkP superfamily phosphohydrolase/phosphomutase